MRRSDVISTICNNSYLIDINNTDNLKVIWTNQFLFVITVNVELQYQQFTYLCPFSGLFNGLTWASRQLQPLWTSYDVHFDYHPLITSGMVSLLAADSFSCCGRSLGLAASVLFTKTLQPRSREVTTGNTSAQNPHPRHFRQRQLRWSRVTW